MGSADSITAHVFQDEKLMSQGCYIDCGSQGAEVVVVADSLKFAWFAIEEEAFFRNEFHGAEPEASLIDICKALTVIEFGNCMVEIRILRGPKLRIVNYEILHERLSFPCLSGKDFFCCKAAVRSVD